MSPGKTGGNYPPGLVDLSYYHLRSNGQGSETNSHPQKIHVNLNGYLILTSE